MGLILLPLIVFWIGSAIFSLRVGYVLLNGKGLFPYITVVLLLAIVTTIVFVGIGLLTFKDRQEVWAFEILFFFLANNVAFSLVAVAVLVYFFGSSLLSIKHIGSAVFIIIFSISFGALIGATSSSKVISHYDIKITY